MAVLSDLDRARTLIGLMRQEQITGNYSKADLRSALDATDAWIEANQSSYNTALPQPFRNQATLVDKTLLFCYVALRRAGRLAVTEDAA